MSTTQPPAAFAQESANLEAEYGADYANSRSIFITDDSSLQDLSFTIVAADPTKPIRALVHGNNQFFEINIAAPRQAATAALVLHQTSALASQGVTLQSVEKRPLSATVTMGSRLQDGVNVQRTAAMSIAGSVRAKAEQANLVLTSEDGLPPTTVTEKQVTASGEQLKPVRPLSIAREPK